MREIIVDNFAGGGGASTGIELAIGRSVDIAINHDENAIAMHKTNHPDTLHYCESVFDVDPVSAAVFLAALPTRVPARPSAILAAVLALMRKAVFMTHLH